MADPMTIQQFGQTIKAKHPEYADMADEDVGNRVLAKYPQYSDMVQKPISGLDGPLPGVPSATPSRQQLADQMNYVTSPSEITGGAWEGIKSLVNPKTYTGMAKQINETLPKYSNVGGIPLPIPNSDQMQSGADQLQAIQARPARAVSSLVAPAILTAGVAKVAPKIIPALKSGVTGNLDAPIPGAEVTPRQRYLSMQATGVQPDAADATNSPILRMTKAVNQNSLTSTPTYEAARSRNVQALNDYTQDTLDKMSKLSAEEGGAAVQKGLLTNQADLKKQATSGFSQLDRERGDQPIAGAVDLQNQAKQIIDNNSEYYKLHPELEPRQATAIVKNIASGGPTPKPAPKTIPGFGPSPAVQTPVQRIPNFSELHRLRSDLLDFNNTNPDLVKNQANGWISQLSGAADNAITSGEGGLSPQQTSVFRDANAAWKDMKNTYDNPQNPLYSAVRTDAPSRLVNGISQTPEMARNLYSRLGAEGLGPIQKGVTEKALGTTKEGNYNFRNFQGNFNKLAPSYRDSLYSPQQLKAIDNIGQTGTVLNEEANPSGTAKLGQKATELGALGSAVASPHTLPLQGLYHATQYGVGKLMNNPTFVDWLMRPPTRGGRINPLIPPVVGVLSGRPSSSQP